MLFLKFDEERVDFEGDSTSADELRDFIKGNQLPLVSEFTQEVSDVTDFERNDEILSLLSTRFWTKESILNAVHFDIRLSVACRCAVLEA